MRRRRSYRDIALVLCAAATAAGLAAWLLGEPASKAAAPVAKTAASGVPPPRDPSPAPPAPARPAGPEGATLRLSPPYEVADAITVLTRTHRVRLAGLEAPAAEAACYDPAGRLWACGLQARAHLNNLIREQALTCRITGSKLGDAVLASCNAGASRLDRLVVRRGFARPLGESHDLGPDLQEAQSSASGLWNGGWRIRH